ncbi:kinesin-like protein KIF15-A isoform X1 [Synchiropus splendidus]|uniref:kinesin-like protein KIF15-A isoform X1 n=2 Tax=Synchiropus splendidus TaxID=270530 RepID=UPI00237D89EA|nr:kinesin-like protein KIF15-A isoform X1 [Synchiropus splendidus]
MIPNGKGSGDSTLHATSSESDSIKVFVRVRPLTQGTGLTTDGDQNLCLTVTSPNTIRLHSKPEPRTFTYDHVADMDTSQDSVFSSVAKNIVESCMNGYNGTIFAYGQTGSGKTFTMLGPSELNNFTDDLRGVIPRSFEYLFFLINREVERSSKVKSFLCKCSFIEIYNEQIYDLLDTASASLFIRENIKKGVFVEGAVEKFVNSAAEAYQVLSMGWQNRRVASTSMNRESSRSHAVFTMTLESKETVNEVVNIRMSQLNLVDLAGSERQKDTHTEGSRLKEASSINRSLMCLGQVIMALVDVSNGKNRHICYRDSKLTFLLRDSLGGNAKTYIIANVHPGSKCFGETLSTLQFAQRAKLIKNKAIVNEDTHGNVRQLQAEVRKLKEQLAKVLASNTLEGGRDSAPGRPELPKTDTSVEVQHDVSYRAKFMAAVQLWRKREEEKKVLLKKQSQLEEAWAQKDKFIHSSRMIVRFREDHIARLEKNIKEERGCLSEEESQAQINQLREEIKILKDQVEHHPRMTRYAAENTSLREEITRLRSLDSVMKAEEMEARRAEELEEAFQTAMERETLTATGSSSSSLADSVSAAAIQKLQAQLLQKTTDFTAVLHAFEEYKEITKKQMSQLESEKRYLDKSNKHLENILEATNSYKKQEVSELNRIHVETLKIFTTPSKKYNQCGPLAPLSSPEHINGTNGGDIWDEQPPSAMTEMALTEELRLVQEQASQVQTQLGEEEMRNSKLLQQIAKLEEQITMLSQESERKDELLAAERAVRSKDQANLQETISKLEQSLHTEQTAAEVLKSEIQDLRLVLQSSDKELSHLKTELTGIQTEHQSETSQLSSSLISTQLQLDKVQMEWEQLLEQHRTLQDCHDQLQAETKFEADQARQQLQDRRQEILDLKMEITELQSSLQMEQEHTSSLTSQFRENRENTLKELTETVEENAHLSKQVSNLTQQNLQQVAKLASLAQNLAASDEQIKILEQKIEQDKDVVLNLINQTRELRSELSQKEGTVSHLSGEVTDITVKYNAACLERESLKEQSCKLESEVCELKEALERAGASNKIEVEILQDEVTYAMEEVERLTKVLDEQNVLLQAAQEQVAEKETLVESLQQKVQQQQDAVEKTVRYGTLKHMEVAVTPKSSPRTPCTPGSFGKDLNQLLESQERELENRRSSMMTMEILLAELHAERSAKNDEIQRLKMQLNEKEIVRLEIQTLLNQFYTKNSQMTENGNSEDVIETIKQSILKELQEERVEKGAVLQRLTETQNKLKAQEAMLAQSQTCVQELTTELRNRCLELRELSHRASEEERLVKEIEVLRKQNVQLSEENGKLVGHKNHKQKIEYLVKLKKENTKLHEENERLRSQVSHFSDRMESSVLDFESS